MNNDENKYEHIFQDALGMLIKHHPFFGHIMANIVRVKDDTVHLLSLSVTDESKIALHYNLKDVQNVIENKKLTLQNLTAIVQHTIYHMINEHFLRKYDGKYIEWVVTPRGPQHLFDICCDININQYINNLPETVFNLNTFEHELPPEENAEYYYQVLLKRAIENKRKLFSIFGDFICGEAVGFLFFNDDKRPLEEQMHDISQFLPFIKIEYMNSSIKERTK